MGAAFNYRVFEGDLSPSEIKSKWQAEVQEELYESGHGGYTGTIAECSGLSNANKVCGSVDEAVGYLEETASKWGDSKAVKVVRPDKGVLWVCGGWYSS